MNTLVQAVITTIIGFFGSLTGEDLQTTHQVPAIQDQEKIISFYSPVIEDNCCEYTESFLRIVRK